MRKHKYILKVGKVRGLRNEVSILRWKWLNINLIVDRNMLHICICMEYLEQSLKKLYEAIYLKYRK